MTDKIYPEETEVEPVENESQADDLRMRSMVIFIYALALTVIVGTFRSDDPTSIYPEPIKKFVPSSYRPDLFADLSMAVTSSDIYQFFLPDNSQTDQAEMERYWKEFQDNRLRLYTLLLKGKAEVLPSLESQELISQIRTYKDAWIVEYNMAIGNFVRLQKIPDPSSDTLNPLVRDNILQLTYEIGDPTYDIRDLQPYSRSFGELLSLYSIDLEDSDIKVQTFPTNITVTSYVLTQGGTFANKIDYIFKDNILISTDKVSINIRRTKTASSGILNEHERVFADIATPDGNKKTLELHPDVIYTALAEAQEDPAAFINAKYFAYIYQTLEPYGSSVTVDEEVVDKLDPSKIIIIEDLIEKGHALSIHVSGINPNSIFAGVNIVPALNSKNLLDQFAITTKGTTIVRFYPTRGNRPYSERIEYRTSRYTFAVLE